MIAVVVQPADEFSVEAGGRHVVFPAWPCEWDVSFQLAAPNRTTVSGQLRNGELSQFSVEPASMTPMFDVRTCQKTAK